MDSPEDRFVLSIGFVLGHEEIDTAIIGTTNSEHLIENVKRGVDMFDCVMPTRNARNGQLFTFDGPINIKNSRYIADSSAIDENSLCKSSNEYTKSYLHHLFKTKEVLGLRIATEHNIAFYKNLMETMRKEIIKNNFDNWSNEFTRGNDIQIRKGGGAGYFCRVEDHINIGGNDPIFQPMYWEDKDLFMRMQMEGYKFIMTSKSLIWHFTSRTSRFPNGEKDLDNNTAN